MAAARYLGAVRSARRLSLSACSRWRGRFLSRGGRRRAALTAHGAAACGAALALPAPAQSYHRTRGGVALGRRSSVAAA